MTALNDLKILIILNGSNLRRWHPRLPERLRIVGARRGLFPEIAISKSVEHVYEIVDDAVDKGIDVIISGGGDGTLHHIVNHPLIPKVIVSMLPAGTINAFLRSARGDYSNPLRAFEQLLDGEIVEGHVGRINGRRFACFASWGFDARVVHKNPSSLKRAIRAGSYVVTGIRELASWKKSSVPGRLRIGGTGNAPFHAGAVVVCKVRNYAGFNAFSVDSTMPGFEMLWTRDESPAEVAALYATIAGRALTGLQLKRLAGVGYRDGVRELAWLSTKPAFVQLDGEEIVLEDSRRIVVDTDPVTQRYLLPRGKR